MHLKQGFKSIAPFLHRLRRCMGNASIASGDWSIAFGYILYNRRQSIVTKKKKNFVSKFCFAKQKIISFVYSFFCKTLCCFATLRTTWLVFFFFYKKKIEAKLRNKKKKIIFFFCHIVSTLFLMHARSAWLSLMPLRVNEATLRGWPWLREAQQLLRFAQPWFLMPLRGKGKQSSAQRLHGEVKLSNRLPPKQKIRAMLRKTKFWTKFFFFCFNLVLRSKT